MYYKVVNYDWNQSLPEIFGTFMEAFEAQKAWDKDASIECVDVESDTVEVVWQKSYEDIYFLDNVMLNSYTPKLS